MTLTLPPGYAVPVTCPKCGHETQQTIGGVQPNPQFTCACGTVIQLKTDGIAGDLARAEQMIRDAFKK